MEELKLANRIINNERYLKIIKHIAGLESDRIFCHHELDHLLDVARIACLMAEDEGLKADRDIIYCAALLHDIGRAEQYENGTKHEIAGVPIARKILTECGADDDDIRIITEAIREHGNSKIKDNADLNGLLYRADKASRHCYICTAADKCHKSIEKRVTRIRY